jgi:rRNA-processing protein FCF1
MRARPPLCVADSNIWVDLHFGRLVEKAFSLPFRFAAPDVIIDELKRPSGSDLVALGLRVEELSGEMVLKVSDLAVRYLRPSRQDLFALVLAEALGAILLTGDGALRDLAREIGVEVHGTIWLLDHMVEKGIIDRQKRAQALRLMLDSGSRLPRDEVELRLDQDQYG